MSQGRARVGPDTAGSDWPSGKTVTSGTWPSAQTLGPPMPTSASPGHLSGAANQDPILAPASAGSEGAASPQLRMGGYAVATGPGGDPGLSHAENLAAAARARGERATTTTGAGGASAAEVEEEVELHRGSTVAGGARVYSSPQPFDMGRFDEDKALSAGRASAGAGGGWQLTLDLCGLTLSDSGFEPQFTDQEVNDLLIKKYTPTLMYFCSGLPGPRGALQQRHQVQRRWLGPGLQGQRRGQRGGMGRHTRGGEYAQRTNIGVDSRIGLYNGLTFHLHAWLQHLAIHMQVAGTAGTNSLSEALSQEAAERMMARNNTGTWTLLRYPWPIIAQAVLVLIVYYTQFAADFAA